MFKRNCNLPLNSTKSSRVIGNLNLCWKCYPFHKQADCKTAKYTLLSLSVVLLNALEVTDKHTFIGFLLLTTAVCEWNESSNL